MNRLKIYLIWYIGGILSAVCVILLLLNTDGTLRENKKRIKDVKELVKETKKEDHSLIKKQKQDLKEIDKKIEKTRKETYVLYRKKAKTSHLLAAYKAQNTYLKEKVVLLEKQKQELILRLEAHNEVHAQSLVALNKGLADLTKEKAKNKALGIGLGVGLPVSFGIGFLAAFYIPKR